MDTRKTECLRSLTLERIRYTTAGVVTYRQMAYQLQVLRYPCIEVSVLINCPDWYNVVPTYIQYNVDGRIKIHNQTVNLAPH